MKTSNDTADALVVADFLGVFGDVANAAVGAGGDYNKSLICFKGKGTVLHVGVFYPFAVYLLFSYDKSLFKIEDVRNRA